MDTNELKQLVDLMNENDLLELEVVEEGKKIRLKKMYDGGTRIMQVPVAAGTHTGDAAKSGGGDSDRQLTGARQAIKSPMVGTFYRASGPEASPYVEIGDEVTPETVLCIIEAMKVFNEIKAEMKGKVVEILVENGQSVEYGQPLFVLDAA